jgi:hypothetical protein
MILETSEGIESEIKRIASQVKDYEFSKVSINLFELNVKRENKQKEENIGGGL